MAECTKEFDFLQTFNALCSDRQDVFINLIFEDLREARLVDQANLAAVQQLSREKR